MRPAAPEARSWAASPGCSRHGEFRQRRRAACLERDPPAVRRPRSRAVRPGGSHSTPDALSCHQCAPSSSIPPAGRGGFTSSLVPMRERTMSFTSDPAVTLAGTLCLPEDSSAEAPVPAIVLLGGTFGDTRDGDMAVQRTAAAADAPRSGLLRRIAHALVEQGVASLRYDKRGCGGSGGVVGAADPGGGLRGGAAAGRALRSGPGRG